MAKYSWQTAAPGLSSSLGAEARRMRIAPTEAEQILWQRLRGAALGVRFRRQHVIGRYIADFVWLPRRLVIELDGPVHDGTSGKDEGRDRALGELGFRVIHFRNDEVIADPDGVVRQIQALVASGGSKDSASPVGEGVGR